MRACSFDGYNSEFYAACSNDSPGFGRVVLCYAVLIIVIDGSKEAEMDGVILKEEKRETGLA
jgi:hypothetical protein